MSEQRLIGSGWDAEEIYCDHGDVVLLAEDAGGLGDAGGGVAADVAGAVEAEEFAGTGPRLDDSVGDEGKAVAGGQLQGQGLVSGVGQDAEREGAGEVGFSTI